MIKEIEKPDGFEEDPPLEDGVDINEQPRNEIVYIAGRLFYDVSGRWVYESFNYCMTTDKFEDPAQMLSQIYEKSEKEQKYQIQGVQEAKDRMQALEEERRQAAASKAAAAKKKKTKKDAVQEEDEKKEEIKAMEPM